MALRRPRAEGAAEAGAADVRRAALGLLARREHTGAELLRKLRERFGAAAPVEPELERLRAEGLQSDERFAESFVRMHRMKGHGPVRILAELRERGVDAATAEAVVDPRSGEWVELARRWRARRFGAAPATGAAQWQREARHLQARGFSAEQVRKALREPVD